MALVQRNPRGYTHTVLYTDSSGNTKVCAYGTEPEMQDVLANCAARIHPRLVAYVAEHAMCGRRANRKIF